MSRTNDLLKSLDSNDFVEVDEDDGITTLIDLDDIFNGMETSAALSNRPVVYPIDEMRDRVEESLEKFENTTFDNEGKWVHAQPNPAASPWPTAFMVDLALDIFDLDHILNKHSVDVEYYTALADTPAFQRELATTRTELHKDGSLYKARVRAQALESLDVSWAMLNDPHTPATVKDSIMERIQRQAGYDNKNTPVDGQNQKLVPVFVKFNFTQVNNR